MTEFYREKDTSWLRARLSRHVSELFRLAVPAVAMRLGLLAVAMVDAALVGHYATPHLAWLNLANQTYVMFSIVVSLGLLTGVLVYTSNAYGRGDLEEAGGVWRRSLPLTALLGLFLVLTSLPAHIYLTWLGQSPEVAQKSGELIRILGLGLPGHALFITCAMFLEGIKRADIGFYVMLLANLVNVFFDYGLIYGTFGMPELGAEGAAWTSTIVRWFMGLAMAAYIWWAPACKAFNVRAPYKGRWSDWVGQRRLGYASAISLAVEAFAFVALAVFAGWLGTIQLAGHGVVYQVLGVPLMIGIGIGVAASVRTGIAHGRGDRPDTLLAALSGIILTMLLSVALAVLIVTLRSEVVRVFTGDTLVVALLVPLTIIYTLGMIFDAMQMAVSGVLRGLNETWWPTFLQSAAFLGVMLPACYVLAFPMERGFQGLLEGTALGVFASCILLLVRFYWLMRPRA